MVDTVTIYSELIEEIVNGTFSHNVLQTRKSLVLQTFVDELEKIVEVNSETKPTRIHLNLLMYLDTETKEALATVKEMPEVYQTYFFNEVDLAMELINNFVLAANKTFIEQKISASITTAKVAARLRAQFLHYLTSGEFTTYHLEMISINNGIIVFSAENPEASLAQIKQDM